MYMYMHMHMHIDMYVCMYVCMYVLLYVCMYYCMYYCMYVCMYVCMNACMHVCMYVCVCVCACARARACVCECVYIYIYIYIYISMSWKPVSGAKVLKFGGTQYIAHKTEIYSTLYAGTIDEVFFRNSTEKLSGRCERPRAFWRRSLQQPGQHKVMWTVSGDACD